MKPPNLMTNKYRKFSNFFLDRDGVINANGFVNTSSELTFLPDSLEALRILNNCGKKTFIATNQGGIEAGYLTEETLNEIHADMLLRIINSGGWIDKIYYCPHLHAECECRKPKPGMLLQGISEYNLQKDDCCFIGDWQTDWEAAIAAGVQPIAVACGRKWGDEQVEFLLTYGIPKFSTLYDAVLALT